MISEIENVDASTESLEATAILPADLAWSHRAAAILRAYLAENDLNDYRIFYARDFDPHDIEQHLPELDPKARWETAPSPIAAGASITVTSHSGEAIKRFEPGFLRLAGFDVVLARWWWISTEMRIPSRSLTLFAAREAADISRLRERLSEIRRDGAEAVWQIVRGYSWSDLPRAPRKRGVDDALLLQPELRERIVADVLNFFDPKVADLYASLNVPYRRGVLLYGPPGNGKTSIIRWIGGTLSHIPAMTVRPGSSFDTDDLDEIVRRWKRQAPALLVIEDLDWVLKTINVSAFLNTIDGVESTVSGGLMLIATTNHPEQLDPAINNRPGRFDVSIEVASPALSLRAEFLRRHLDGASFETIDRIAQITDGCALAHLHEILRLSGLFAIHAGRSTRIDADSLRAADEVVNARDAATRGFPAKPELPFGLQHLRGMKRK